VTENPAVAMAEALRDDRRTAVDALVGARVTLLGLVGDHASAPVKVVVLAQAVPGVGKVRSRRVLSALRIPEATRWGELSPETARRVAEALAEAAAEGPG
jgi:hypothetical protein